MARDTFKTFKNSKFNSYNSFKVNCVGLNQSKEFVDSLYNRDLIQLVAIRTLKQSAEHENKI